MLKADTRSFTRKPIRGQAIVVLPGGERRRGRVKDLSLGGICIVLPDQLPEGLKCTTALETVHEGRVVHLVATGKVIYSILSGTEGFRTGFQFTDIDAANDKLLAELMI